jgi:xanthine dehydrogenase YagS FAD-binding subunit
LNHQASDTKEIEESHRWLSQHWNRPARPLCYSPTTLEDALSLLDEYGNEAAILAGGIDLIGLMKQKVIAPRMLVNIKRLEGLDRIVETERGLEIGALVLLSALKRSDVVRRRYRLLAEAAQSIASPQIGNMATVAGNLCQDVRCWYYRRSPETGISYPCRRKRKEGICYAAGGENENHAIFGEGECYAVSASDLATALSALDAVIKTISTHGTRTIPIREFHTPLGHVLRPNEIITGISVPEIPAGAIQEFIKFRVRKAIDFATASVAVVLTFDRETVSDASIVMGGVSPVPYAAVKAEQVVRGESLSESLAERAAKAAVADAMPLKKNKYKVAIAETLVKRALLKNKESTSL